MKISEYGSVLKKEPTKLSFWRDVTAEVLSTFMLLAVQCALVLKWPVGMDHGNVVHVAIGMGFVVCVLVWTFGEFGGCHMNPAVTIAMAASLQITVFRALLYICAQCAGAIAGAAFIYGVTPENRRGALAATLLNPELKEWQGVLIEIWLTFQLVMVILGATNIKRKGHLYMHCVPIGFAVTLGVMNGSAQTGASMNPARSLGPAVVMGLWDHHWIYWSGPILGALLALGMYKGYLNRVDRPSPAGNDTSDITEHKDSAL